MTVDMPCDCTHPKDGHAGLAYACWTCDCKRYTPDIQAASNAARKAYCPCGDFGPGDQSDAHSAAHTAWSQRCKFAAGTTGGESTSARLRRVEQERDQANDLTDKIAAELRLVTRERDSLARRCAVRFEETRAVEAELASACAELKQLRAQLAERGAP